MPSAYRTPSSGSSASPPEDLDGYSWKFHDYFLSVGRRPVPPGDCSAGVDLGSLPFNSGIVFDYGKFLGSCPFNFKGVVLHG